MTKARVLLLVVIALLVTSFFALELGQYLTLDYIKSQQAQLNSLVAAHPLVVAAVYFSVYVLVTAVSLPGAAIMTLAGGAMFGLGWGIAGLCPGPAMFLAVAGYQNVLMRWWPSFFVGAFLAEKVKNIQIGNSSSSK